MWEQLSRDRVTGDDCYITAEDLHQSGDVNEALERFYEATLPGVMAGTGVSERALRAWVSGALITPAQTRGLVYRGATDTAGLPHPGIDLFDAGFLVRPVLRGSDTWYELSHDRLVEPIQEANRRWQADYANPLTEAALTWKAGGNQAADLLEGRGLITARAFAATHPGDLTEDETAFLAASEDAYREARRRRTLTVAGIVGVALLALMAGLALIAGAQSREQRSLAESRRLAAAAMDTLDADPGWSVQLGMNALQSAYTREADQSLHTAVQQLRLLNVLDAHSGPIWDVAVSPDGARIATAGDDGAVRQWNAETGAPVREYGTRTSRVWSRRVQPRRDAPRRRFGGRQRARVGCCVGDGDATACDIRRPALRCGIQPRWLAAGDRRRRRQGAPVGCRYRGCETHHRPGL